ncbi:GDYXXLXY domain-containing protein [Paenibacillus sedimenti]|uniref:GDYXXLXY domain-containing protein n=1 Tax=Paenibacillus sedimenti TaxID=2770274 RepID=A0A926KMY5_9BACL|nr:GDYXXLXY domain-containing protein [Paenibacillus sedimenti]MBD0380807.1 GDYXXLXY domain-containing protein [Paenibacillus sedimenti]
MMKSKFVSIQLGYVLGASSLLTAIVYFFATNWQALTRAQKFAPIFILIFGFYGLSVWLSHKSGREFLSRLGLFASCISFGVGIALIGQTYNSHADSYSLFAVWFVPALLYALFTRWQPFYILAYILGHLAYLFYFFPLWRGNPDTEAIEIIILLVLAIANGCLYMLTERGRLHSPILRWVAFQAALGIMLWLSNSIAYEQYGPWMNLPLLAVLAVVIQYVRKTKNKSYLLFAGLWVSMTVTVKYIELAIRYYSELFYIGGILFVILFIGANVKFVQVVRAWNPPAEKDNEAKPEGDFTKWVARVLTVSVIVIGTLIGSLSLIGLVTGVLGFRDPQYVLIGFGILAIVSMIFAVHVNSLVRYTLLCCGLLIGAGAAAAMDYTIVLVIFLALTILAFANMTGKVQRILFFLVSEAIAAFILHNLLGHSVAVFLVLTTILFVIFITAQLIRNETVRAPLQYSSFPSFLLAFFILTFITEFSWYYMSNGLYFLAVIAVLIISRQLQSSWTFSWGMTFWIAFLVYKYYDLAWKLLHKSVSLAILGLLIIGITVWYEQRNRQALAAEHAQADYSWYVKGTRLLIAVLLMLQLSAMSLQIGKSEWLLSHGQLIKLELAPLDPRSLMQGDYVRLHYAISDPELPAELERDRFFHKKIAVVLAPDASTGVYEFRRLYTKGEQLSPGEIRMNGTIGGLGNVEYGIETYFIPEGTGQDVERNARYAVVKVSANGDAILVRLLQETSLVR